MPRIARALLITLAVSVGFPRESNATGPIRIGHGTGCPMSNIRMQGIDLSTDAASADTSMTGNYESGEGAFDLVHGTSHVGAGSAPEWGTGASVVTRDEFTLIGLAPDDTVFFTARLRYSSGIYGPSNWQAAVWVEGEPTEIVSDQRYAGGASHVESGELVLPLWRAGGKPFTLAVATGINVVGAGGGSFDGDLAFGLPDGVSITSCQGFENDAVTSTHVALRSVEVSADRVELTWYSSEARAHPVVERRTEAFVDWRPVGEATVDASGMIRFLDRGVTPAVRYGYRLVFASEFEPVGEAWVDVPARAAISLAATPNPARGDWAFAAALPRTGHATIEVVDLSGRVVASHHIQAVGGSQRVSVPGTRTMNPGIYFVRLRQGPHSVTTRAALMR
jgi:hypothetical protein